MGNSLDELGPSSATGALRWSEERFRLLVESVSDYAIYLLDVSGRVESWNPGAQRLKGYRPDEIIGQHYSVFYTAPDRADRLPDRLLATAREQGRTRHSGWRVRKDGTRFWADAVITALFDDDGQHTGFAKVTRDMTEAHLATEARERALEERQQAVQRLEELDRWRRDFVSMIAHDLQTPIVGINGFLDLVLAGQIPDDELPDVHERLRSNARSMQELVDNLRAYTLLQEGRVEFRPQQLPLADFTAQLLADMAPVLREHTTRVDVPDDLRISIDRQALERILRNLLGNAARHTPPGTTVSIRAHRQGPTVIVEVHDDGPGIPDDLLERMFERFERGSSGGTGLGLAIARQLVELHDGAIEVISEPGAGAVFRLRLPDTDRSRDAHPEDSAR